ncbi:MAG: guanitoxin biosynthesis heme-dependent pre-guanitoxin N-hydroxylase GntA [Phycisphaerales bacterium]
MISTKPVTIRPSTRVFAPDSDSSLRPEREGSRRDPGPAAAAIHAALRAFITHQAYPCVGAKASLNKGTYRIAQYGELGRASSALECARDLQWFAQHARDIDEETASFIAVFDDPHITDVDVFEQRLWAQLQGMHDVDALKYDWDPSVASDPADPDFSFSIGGRGFFIVGLHPHAPREARRFPYPTLVFNLHEQFEAMREQGNYEKIKASIRKREERLEGTPNPLVADHGTISEAQQYAGKAHACPWHPNFTAHNDNTEGNQLQENSQ